MSLKMVCFFFFFFQAEDGIRDWSVTGVQTCALPILTRLVGHLGRGVVLVVDVGGAGGDLGRGHERCRSLDEQRVVTAERLAHRSEERRVGKECRSRWSA